MTRLVQRTTEERTWDAMSEALACKCVMPTRTAHRAPIDCRDEEYWTDLRDRYIKLRDETEAAPAGQTVFTLFWEGDIDCGGRNGYVGTYAAQSLAARAAYSLLPRGEDETEWYQENRDYEHVVLALNPDDGERTTLMVVESEVEGEHGMAVLPEGEYFRRATLYVADEGTGLMEQGADRLWVARVGEEPE